MAHADGGRWPIVEEAHDASGVHVSDEPRNEAAWRALLAPQGASLPPQVEALLGAYIRLRERHEKLVRSAEAMAAALDRLPLGIVTLTDGRIVSTNRQARRLIDGEGLKRTVEDGLAAHDPDAHRALTEGFETLARGKRERVSLLVPRQRGELHVVLTTAGEALAGTVLVAIADPSEDALTDMDGYRTLYGLTPTEAKVAMHLVLGRAPREIAEVLGVGVETTRTHVKHILAKMGCHRQVDVVRRLVTGPASLL